MLIFKYLFSGGMMDLSTNGYNQIASPHTPRSVHPNSPSPGMMQGDHGGLSPRPSPSPGIQQQQQSNLSVGQVNNSNQGPNRSHGLRVVIPSTRVDMVGLGEHRTIDL